jgi:hypothetical protein
MFRLIANGFFETLIDDLELRFLKRLKGISKALLCLLPLPYVIEKFLRFILPGHPGPPPMLFIY